MNRKTFQYLAQIRLQEAKTLLDNGHYAGAYYISGYVIECALKACIAKQTNKHDFPPKVETVRDIYTHELSRLIKAAGLSTSLDHELRINPDFSINWGIAKDWSEQSRYQSRTEQEAQALYQAISHRTSGVFRWLKRHW